MTATNYDKKNGEQNGQKVRALRPWPWWAQFIFALIALLFIGFLWVGLPLLSTLRFGGNFPVNESGVWAPMVASMLGITTMTITAIFLFMTFRIDRGTRREARETARETVEELTKLSVKVAADKAAEEAENAAKAAASRAEAATKKLETQLEQEIRKRAAAVEADARGSIEGAIEKHVSEESLNRMFRNVLVKSFGEEERKALHVQTVTEWMQSMSPAERNSVRDLLNELTATLKQSRRRRWFGR